MQPDEYLLEGSEHETPVYSNTGETDGPTVVVFGGVHGDERAGYTAAATSSSWDVEKGELIVIPLAHNVAVTDGNRGSKEVGDLNRAFPVGSAPTNKLAQAIWDFIKRVGADAVLDLHSSQKTRQMGGEYSHGNAFYWGLAAKSVAETVRDRLNDGHLFGLDPDIYGFTLGNEQGSKGDKLLADKLAAETDIIALLVEVARRGTTMAQRLVWHTKIIQWAAEEIGVEFAATASPDQPDDGSNSDSGGGRPTKPPTTGDGGGGFDLGDHRGSEINSVLRDLVADHDDVHVVLPRGDYHLAEDMELRDFQTLTIESPGEARLVVEDDLEYALVAGAKFDADPASAPQALTVRNVTFDYGQDGVGPVALRGRVAQQLEFENVAVEGQANGTPRKLGTVMAAVTSKSGYGEVRGLDLSDGAAFEPDRVRKMNDAADWNVGQCQQAHAIGVSAPDDHRGTIRFVDCTVSNWPNNGLYLAGDNVPPGTYIVDGGQFANNGNQNLRPGPGDVVRGNPELMYDATMEQRGMTGTALAIDSKMGTATVESATIRTPAAQHDIIRVSGAGATLRDIDVVNASSQKVLEINAPSEYEAKHVVVENLTVDDSGSGQTQNRVVEVNRPGVTLRDVKMEIKHTGKNGRHGIALNGDHCSIEGDSRVLCHRDDTTALVVRGKGTGVSGLRAASGQFVVENANGLHVFNSRFGSVGGVEAAKLSGSNTVLTN